MRLPSLSLHSIEGARAGPRAKTAVPAKVGGKFSIRSAFSLVLLLALPLYLLIVVSSLIWLFKTISNALHSLVPPQMPAAVEPLGVESDYAKLGSKNKM